MTDERLAIAEAGVAAGGNQWNPAFVGELIAYARALAIEVRELRLERDRARAFCERHPGICFSIIPEKEP